MLRLSCFPVLVPVGYADPHFRLEGRTRPCPARISFSSGGMTEDRDLRTPGVQAHNAIDIFGGRGLHIVASTDGTVLNSWRFMSAHGPRPGVGTAASGTDGGNYVLILDSLGNVHYYAHLMDPPLVQAGQSVTAGVRLGLLGNSGRAGTTCPHLHYQVYAPSGAAPSGLDLDGRRFRFANPYLELDRLRPPRTP